MNDAIIVQRPQAAATPSAELVLLFHGVASRAEDLLPLGDALAAYRPGAWVVSARSPDPSHVGSGWQWFSVQGITETNRAERVAGAMPAFLQTIAKWQRETGASPQTTTLIGFSQGAIMALESTQQAFSAAGRVIAIAGRFVQAVRQAPVHTQVHLLHGEKDPVMPVRLAVEAHEQLQALGAASSLDRFPGLGHGIDARVVECIQRRLVAQAEIDPA